MLFNSIDFGLFLAFVLGLYSLTPARSPARKWLLLFSSYWFYASWKPAFLLLLIGSTVLDFAASHRIAGTQRVATRRAWLLASCVGNLGVLAFFKYGSFALSNLARIDPLAFDVPTLFTHIALPVGISFYTFQSLSHTIDVYRGARPPSQTFLDFAIYVAFFPQLVAGPILRSTQFLPQIEEPRNPTPQEILSGIDQVVRGLAKKVLIADGLAEYVDIVYGSPAEFGALNHLLAIYAYAIQIYCDFSGYSDIAIGVARILGFQVPTNFRLPYLARNPSEFWRRWHITLSTWLRDYLYIPLGGSRRGRWRTYLNLMLTMVLGGLWHGAAWPFVLWGAYHGGWLMIHRFFRGPHDSHAPPQRRGPGGIVATAATFHGVCLGWTIFRAPTFADLALVWDGLLDFSTPFHQVPPMILLLLLIGVGSHVIGDSRICRGAWLRLPVVLRGVYYAFITAALFFRSSDTVPFIYFQF